MPSETLTIETTDTNQLMYTFIVDGNVDLADAGGGVSAVGELESDGGNVTIQNRSDGTVQVDGLTGGDYGDAFEIDGTLMSFSGNTSTSVMILELGGESFTPANLPLETGDPDNGNGNGNGDTDPDDDDNGDTDPEPDPDTGGGWFSNITPEKAMLGLGAFGVAYTIADDIRDD